MLFKIMRTSVLSMLALAPIAALAAPTAVDDALPGTEDVDVIGNLLTNDAVPVGSGKQLISVSTPAEGGTWGDRSQRVAVATSEKQRTFNPRLRATVSANSRELSSR